MSFFAQWPGSAHDFSRMSSQSRDAIMDSGVGHAPSTKLPLEGSLSAQLLTRCSYGHAYGSWVCCSIKEVLCLSH